MASLFKVQLNDSHISISHRLPKIKTTANDQVHYKNTKVHLPNIVRFSNRDKRNALHQKRKLLKYVPKNNQALVTIQENLTFRKKIFSQRRKKGKRILEFLLYLDV